MADVIVIGAGPAGVSAALTLKHRNQQVLVISNPPEQSALWKAKLVENYPGLPSVSGSELLRIFRSQIKDAGISVVEGRALSALATADSIGVSVGQDYYSARALLLATGVVQSALYPGEKELLGRGVSYCATCDGMLYKGKSVAVIGLSPEAQAEARFLSSLGCKVEFFDRDRAKKFEILGDERVSALMADGETYPCSCVFILRSTLAPASLLPGIAMNGSFIAVDEGMRASLPGVFACGDCVGKPYQLAVATGRGNLAALSAAEYLDKLK